MRNPDFAIARSAAEAPHEACGVTIDGRAFALENTSRNPKTSFRVEGEELVRLIKDNPGDWDGVWHSHPEGQPYPSEDDLRWHPTGKTLYIVTESAVYEFTDKGDPTEVYHASR